MIAAASSRPAHYVQPVSVARADRASGISETLKGVYDGVAAAPLPDRLARLAEQLEAALQSGRLLSQGGEDG